jgi:lysozyme family protein
MAEFKPAFEFVLLHEDASRSGKVTEDAGGRTRFGIAEKFHPELPDEFLTGPADEALPEAEQIEDREYWQPMRLSEVQSQEVANKLLDMAVNMGVRQAAVYGQRATNYLMSAGGQAGAGIGRIAEDGEIGEKTLAAVNALDPQQLHQALRQMSEAHYRHIAAVNPAQAVNLEGWLKRAEA